MNTHYSAEENVQILLSLLKAYGIRKIIASPGTTNINFVASVQSDDFFQLFSSIDERSAAYMACGMAAESGEPVALSCTGATASRNYIPGLTEAFYRQLPVLAITSTQNKNRVGHLIPQVIDRSTPLNDMVKTSVHIQNIQNDEDKWECTLKINKALIALTSGGKGPVHINLETSYNKDFSITKLPAAKHITFSTLQGPWPELKGKTAIFIGAHKKFTAQEEAAIENFCNTYNAVVFTDHTSNYKGKHAVLGALIFAQLYGPLTYKFFDTVIYLGTISGDYPTATVVNCAKNVWLINEDGVLRDRDHNLSAVFQMTDLDFFQHYAPTKAPAQEQISQKYQDMYKKLRQHLPQLPFSNPWLAQQTAHLLPQNSVLHLGILNSLRSWNFFTVPDSVYVYSNVGGFGIDGGLSTLLGASLVHPETLYLGVLGDLAFFYDMNALGNRHLGSNLRILLVNNGKGTEFKNFNHLAAKFGNEADQYMAAAGHFGQQSRSLVKHLAEDLGLEYLAAADKEEFLQHLPKFISPKPSKKAILLEVFTNSQDESDALESIQKMQKSMGGEIKEAAKKVLPAQALKIAKKILKK